LVNHRAIVEKITDPDL